MADKRKADVFAGEGSFAGKLRKRREDIESGKYTDDIELADGGKADGGHCDGACDSLGRKIQSRYMYK